MGINLTDIVALAKAGYKPSEVKELISLANQSEDPAPEGEQKGKAENTEQHDAGKEQPEEAQQNATSTPSEDGAILSYKEKIQELEEKLQKLQQENVHRDQSGQETEKSDEDLVNEITASFM